jgi:hypothetical protein
MRVNTRELQGQALDYAVAYSHGRSNLAIEDYHPSTDWAQGGPLIEREGIELSRAGRGWWAMVGTHAPCSGDTPLMAAMRCYVVYKWNDQIEIPKEFV